MVLGCFICRQPLIKRTKGGKGKLKFQSNAIRLPTTNIKMETLPAHASQSLVIYQPVTTKCGHIFHKGCLKEYIAKTPVRFGGKIECPVCLKVMTLSQCFNVYLNAMPSGSNPHCMFEQLENLDRENARFQKEIGLQKEKLEELDSIYKETRAHINRVGKEIMRKTNELKIFADYCKKTGGMPELQQILEDPYRKAMTRALEAQNDQLYKLIEEHKAADESKFDRDHSRSTGRVLSDHNFLDCGDADLYAHHSCTSEDIDLLYNSYHDDTFSKLKPKLERRPNPDTRIQIRQPESPEFLAKIAAYLDSYKGTTDPEDSLTD